MIFLGLIGLIFLRRVDQRFSYIALGFFISFYFSLSFGTSPQLRNIEIRYFLMADILLLIPASFLISIAAQKLFLRLAGNKPVA
jgi:hypothetical protein